MADEAWLATHLPESLSEHPWLSALGSVGGGNHFAELQQVDEVFDAPCFQQAGLNAGHLQLLVHSGSRGLGQAILQQVRAEGDAVLDVAHNFVESCNINGEQGWLHSKGATPDGCGLVMIPGSRGDYSWLVQPVISEETLHSLAHGAWQPGDLP